MKITAIHLPSFRSFQAVEVPTAAAHVYIAGINGAGKSTLGREAIRWVVTGKAQGLDGKGAGIDRLVPGMNGASGVQAGITIDGLGLVERRWSPTTGSTLTVEGFTGNLSDQQAALYAWLKTTEPFIHAAIDNHHFLHLHHAEAKAMVLDLLHVRVVIGEGPDAPAYTLEELETAYRGAFDDRKVAKKRLSSVIVPAPPIEPAHANVADIDRLLATRRQELERLVAEGGSVSGQRRSLEHRRAGLQAASEAYRDPQSSDLSDQITDLEERLAIMEADAISVSIGSGGDPPQSVGAVAHPVDVLEHRLKTLRAHKPAGGCVLDPEVTCETAKIQFTRRVKALQAEIDALPPIHGLQEAIGTSEDFPVTWRSEYLGQPRAAVNPITDVRRQLDTLKTQQARDEQAKEQQTQRQTELAEIERQLSNLEDTTNRETTIADLRSRIAKGEQYRLEAGAYWKAAQRHQAALDEAQTLRTEVDRLEQLCDVLGPSGARVQALQEKVVAFEAQINAFTQSFGWTVQFVLDPWGVTVNHRPVETYSQSEQYLVGIAIQLAVAQLSGLKFAVVDELDLLLQAPRNVVQALLWSAPLDQIFILSSREPDRPLPSAVPNLLSYRLSKTDQGSVVS